ncbi:MAG: hypothetical protein ACMUEK_03695 [Sodalis sp. (in: enterobacteria)]
MATQFANNSVIRLSISDYRYQYNMTNLVHCGYTDLRISAENILNRNMAISSY